MKKALPIIAVCTAALPFAFGEAAVHLGMTRQGLAFSSKIKDLIEKKHGPFFVSQQEETEEPSEKELAKNAAFAAAGAMMDDPEKRTDVYIDSPDGAVLHAARIKGDQKRWVITCHGFTSGPGGMAIIGYEFSKLGFSVLLPSLRGHSQNSDDRISMGYKDADDLILWVRYILKESPDAEIVIHGESMGAVTVMRATGMPELPGNVKCCIADCGFSSGVKQYLRIAGFASKRLAPIAVAGVNCALKLERGYSMKDIVPAEAVAKSKTPTLFIHGEKDSFIPVSNTYTNYAFCSAPKDMLIVPGAEHAESKAVGYEMFFDKAREFVAKYIDINKESADGTA